MEEDQEFVRDYYEMPDDAIDTNRLSPWLLRIVLDRAMLLDKKLSVADVAERINNEFEDELSCIFNDDNALQQVLRVGLLCLPWLILKSKAVPYRLLSRCESGKVMTCNELSWVSLMSECRKAMPLRGLQSRSSFTPPTSSHASFLMLASSLAMDIGLRTSANET